jgi:hypothetical protein
MLKTTEIFNKKHKTMEQNYRGIFRSINATLLLLWSRLMGALTQNTCQQTNDEMHKYLPKVDETFGF